MRLMIVGRLNGQLSTATKIAMDRGARVSHADTIDTAIDALRSGRGADLLMVDVALDIAALSRRLSAEHIHVPIVACGVVTDARAAVAAIQAGAKEYIPLPPDAELIAAVLEAVASEDHNLICRDGAIKRVIELADHIAGDVYFKVHREGHNLDRARVQFRMVERMEQNAEAMAVEGR